MKFRIVGELLSSIKWKLYKLNEKLMRRKLDQSDFYEDILCTECPGIESEMHKSIASWMFRMKKYEQIEIKKFKDLFKGLDEVVFPIQVSNYWEIHIEIIDSKGEKYYLSSTDDYYDKYTEYCIGKRNSSLECMVDKIYNFRICRDGTIELLKTTVPKPNQDGSNSDISYELYYNHNTNTKVVTVYSKENKLTVECSKEYEIDKGITKYFEEKCYYDVFPVLKCMVSKMARDDISIHITSKINDEVFSEVEVVNSVVEKYTFTKKTLPKTIDEFLNENSLN